MAVSSAHVFPGFLTPVQTPLFFPKPPTTFLTCFCIGGRRKLGLNSKPPGHEPTELPGWGCQSQTSIITWLFFKIKSRNWELVLKTESIRRRQNEWDPKN